MMISTTLPDKKKQNPLSKLLAALILLGLWQLAAMAIGQEILFVSPATTLSRIWELGRTLAFWETVARSCLRILLGFCLAVGAGTVLAVLTSFVPLLHSLFSPLIGIVKATPVSSFILLALVWIKSWNLSIFISFLMVLPMVWANVSQGIEATDAKLLEVARLFRFSRWKTLWKVYLPSVRPYFVAACTTGMGFAWKSGIAAEVLGTPRGTIGRELYNAKIYLETPDLFAWTAVVVLMSVLIEKGMLALLNQSRRRKGGRP